MREIGHSLSIMSEIVTDQHEGQSLFPIEESKKSDVPENSSESS